MEFNQAYSELIFITMNNFSLKYMFDKSYEIIAFLRSRKVQSYLLAVPSLELNNSLKYV